MNRNFLKMAAFAVALSTCFLSTAHAQVGIYDGVAEVSAEFSPYKENTELLEMLFRAKRQKYDRNMELLRDVKAQVRKISNGDMDAQLEEDMSRVKAALNELSQLDTDTQSSDAFYYYLDNDVQNFIDDSMDRYRARK